MYGTLLVPTDGSPGSSEAAKAAIELADRFDATVHALFVIDERHVPTEFDLPVEAAEREGEQAVEEIERLGADLGVSVEKHLRRGVPSTEILEAIDAYPAEMVVMGTHGRTGLERLVHLGGVTEHVIRASPVPVVTIPIHSEDGSSER
ncbi:universal stress protein [Halopenitus sp. H-Gu1]|uniref:universal stress protein n=1 Tax=Halopenitus sp. H-Gu1 TaxID=3242697 RepID=UPI00359DA325